MLTVSYRPRREEQIVELVSLRELRTRKLGHDPTLPHRPSFYLMLLYTEGEGVHRVDDRLYSCRRGTLLCVTPGQVQALPSDPSAEARMLLFTREAFSAARLLSGPLEASGVFDHRMHSPVTELGQGETERLETLAGLIGEESEAVDESIRQDVLSHLFTVWILLTGRYAEVKKQRQTTPFFEDYRRFTALLDAMRGETRNARDYAVRLGMSPRHLRRVTAQVADRTPKQIIDDDMTMEIKRRLLIPGMPLKQIAAELGFDEVTALVKYFRRHTQTTPGAWREGALRESVRDLP